MQRRRVKCQHTGEFGYNVDFYRVETKGRAKYFKSEEVYWLHIREKQLRKDCLGYFKSEILKYDSKTMLSSYTLKRFKELNNHYDYKVILNTLKSNVETLSYWASRDDKFSSETGKVSYLFVIINNKINDEYIKYKNHLENIKLATGTTQDDEYNSLMVEELNKANTVGKKKIKEKVDITELF